MSWITRFRAFFKEVRIEARKVTWPSKQELKESTTVVIVTVWLLAVFIFFVDHLTTTAVKAVL